MLVPYYQYHIVAIVFAHSSHIADQPIRHHGTVILMQMPAMLAYHHVCVQSYRAPHKLCAALAVLLDEIKGGCLLSQHT